MWRNYNYLIEYREVLKKVASFMLNKSASVSINWISGPLRNWDEESKESKQISNDHAFGRITEFSEEDREIGGDYRQQNLLNLSSIAGIIQREDILRMK